MSNPSMSENNPETPGPVPPNPSDVEKIKPIAEAAAGADASSAAPEPQNKEGETSALEDAGGKAVKTKNKKRTWKRRITLALIFLLSAAILFRIALAIAFPIVLKKVAASYGLDASYERFTLSLTGGDVGLGRLTFTPQGSTEPVASADYVRATISPLKLLVGKLEVWRVEADGGDLLVDRDANGKMPVLEKLLANLTPAEPAKPAATAAPTETAPTPIDLTSPLTVEGFRLNHMQARIRDKSVSPPLLATIRMDLRVDDVGSSLRPARFEFDLYCDPVLDALQVSGEARTAGASLEATVTASIKGLHLKAVAGYLQPLGLKPIADTIAMQMNGRITTNAAGVTAAVGKLATAAAAASRPGNVAPPAFAADAKPADAITCRMLFQNMSISVDGREAAAVDSFTLDGTSLNASHANIASVLIDGVRAKAERNLDGNFAACGIELIPVAAAAKPAPAPGGAAQPAAAAPSPSAHPFTAALDKLAVRKMRLTVDDQFVEPATTVALLVDEFSIADLVLDPAKPNAPIKITGAFAAPGIARTIRLDGTATPFAPKKLLALKFMANGVSPKLLQPYLDLLGLESRLQDASFTADLTASAAIDAPTGKVSADARFDKISFNDKQELFGLDDVSFSGVALDPKTGALKVGAIEVNGPALALRRDANGEFEAFGFKTKKPVVGREAPPQPQQPPSDIKLGKIELDRFTWKGIKFSFEDLAASPPETVTLADAGVEIANLKVDLETKNPKPTAATIRAWLAVPKVAEKLEAKGTLTPTTGSIALDLNLSGQGITAAGIKGYLKSIGIEPMLKDGASSAHLLAKLSQGEHGPKVSLQLDGVKHMDGHTELAGVDLFKVDDVDFDAKTSTLTIGNIEIDKPRTVVTRNAAGLLETGGIRLVPIPVSPAATPAVAVALPSSAVATVAVTDSAKPPAGTGPATVPTIVASPAALPIAIVLNGLHIKDSAVQWIDLEAPAPVHTALHAGLDLTKITLGRGAMPGELKTVVSVDDVMDRATVSGELEIGWDAALASLKLDASGVRGTALAPYLPPAIQLKLKDGRLTSSITAGFVKNPEGGISAGMMVGEVAWRDGAEGPALFKMQDFRVKVPRVDLPGNVVAIDDVILNGLELNATTSADGSLNLLGVSIGGPAAAPAAPATSALSAAPPAPENAAAVTGPATQPAAPPALAVAPENVASIVARARKQLPLITLKNLDLNVARIGYHDLSLPDVAPIALTDLRFHNFGGIELLGADPMNRPPAKFELTGHADPLIGDINVQAQIAPFAQEPSLLADVALTGIKGDGLFSIVPAMKERIDASKLQDGEFRTHVEAQAKLDRRGPMDIDFTKGFEAELEVKGTEFRGEKSGPVLLGLDELRVEEAEVKPAANSVRIKSLELTKPIGRVLRDKDGIHAAGLLIKEVPSPATQPASQPTSQTAGGSSTEPATLPASQPTNGPVPTQTQPASQTAVAQKPSGEILIDKLTVSGIDFRAEDRTVDPPAIIPLTALDVDVRNISSLAMYEDLPIRFDLSVNAGKIRLPKKAMGGLVGALGDAAGLLGGKKIDIAPEFEDRELFAEVMAGGRVSLFPRYHGWAKANVTGFETVGVAGFAKQNGINLTHGTFDLSSDVRFADGSALVTARPAFTDLSVTEPPNGPIFRFLHLSAPLDIAIGAVEAADKSITLPIKVSIAENPSGGFAIGGIQSSIVGAVSSVIENAILAIPAKAAEGTVSLLFGSQDAKPEEPIILNFPVGSTVLEPSEQAKLTALVKRMQKEPDLQTNVKHDLGSGDMTLAEVRANPTTGDAEAIADALHYRKIELSRLRTDTAAQVRVRLAAGGGPEAQAAIERLRDVDRDISRTEDALDRIYDLLRPGADRQAPRRTRAAVLAISHERLDVVRQAFVAAAIPNLGDRLKLASPQLTPSESPGGGTLTITLLHVKPK